MQKQIITFKTVVFSFLFLICFSAFAQVVDTIPPVVHLNTADTVHHEVNYSYSQVKVTVTDNHSDSSQISIMLASNVNPFQIGIYTDRYTVRDSAGNVTLKIRYVKVGDTMRPTITSKRKKIQVELFQSNFDLSKYLVLQDNYDPPQLLKDSLREVYNDVNFYEEGFYAVSFVTNDKSGNYSKEFLQFVEVVRYISVKNIDQKSLSISPNPAKYYFNIVGLSTISGTITLFSSKGEKVLTQKISSNKNVIDAGHFAPGIYQLVITTNKAVQTRKVVIQ